LEHAESLRQWRVTSSAGVDLGVWSGATPADALDAMARDAGYENQADATAIAGPFDGTVERVA